MKIKLCGEGIHLREIVGIERFKNELPANWYGWSNLDCVLGAGKVREIDLIVVSNRQIYLVDLKDWFGTIESVGGGWTQNGDDRGYSPVQKITSIARELGVALGKHIKKNHHRLHSGVPRVHGVVVLTGQADFAKVAENEKDAIFRIDDFLRSVSKEPAEKTTFGNVAPLIVQRGLQDADYRKAITTFFTGTAFKPGKKRFQRFVAEDVPDFEPEHGIYKEYEARGDGANNHGTLRLWDFSQCSDPFFHTRSGREEIAGREEEVYNWLKSRNDRFERIVLPPRHEDPERGTDYWQIFERRKRMQRLRAFVASDGKDLMPDERIDLSLQLLVAVAELHSHDAAHLDLGAHSIWLERPTSVRLSHLFAARYPEVKSLGNSRYQFLSAIGLPEDILEIKGGHRRYLHVRRAA